MKAILRLFLSVSLFCILICIQAQGQTYNIFSLGGLNYLTAHSIIRCIDDHRAIAYYENPSNTVQKLALIDIYGNVIVSKLNDGYYVHDIQFVGDDVYFCGSHNHIKGFIGHVKISDFENHIPNVTYHDLDINYASRVTKMVAYRTTAGTKIAAIGHKYYSDTSIGRLCNLLIYQIS